LSAITATRSPREVRSVIHPDTAAIRRSNSAKVVTSPSDEMIAGRSGAAAAADETRS
jgi:hypothetical protein